MKKIKKMILAILVLSLGLSACSGGNENGGNEKEESDINTEAANNGESEGEKILGENKGQGKVYKIGISQLMEHQSLDLARQGFLDGLDELGVNYEVDYKNAQGDVTNSNTIASQFASDKVDLIFAISTPSAQSAQNATKDIPILFTAVTDPVDSGLVDSKEKPSGNITGTSDEGPIREQLAVLKEVDPQIKKVGVIYSTSEKNSEIQLNVAKEEAENLGLEIVETGITTVNDIPQAMDSLMPKIDAMYLLTDNQVANSVSLVSDKLLENKIPSSTAFDAAVEDGILLSEGISYYDLGKQTAKQAKEILEGKEISEVPVEKAETTKLSANKNTIEALGLDATKAPFDRAEIIEK